jgi:hypothetical protein
MKKIIAIMALAAFTCAATAGSDCCPSKGKDKGKDAPVEKSGGEKKKS